MTTANEGTHSPDIAQALTQLEDAYDNVFEQVKKLMDANDGLAEVKAFSLAAMNLGCLVVYMSGGDGGMFEKYLRTANNALNEISRDTFADASAMHGKPLQ